VPEAELRQTFESTPDGQVGSEKPTVDAQTVVSGQQKYTDIKVPVLAIFAIPHNWGPFIESNPASAAAIEPGEMVLAARANEFEAHVTSAHVVRLPHANHYVFLSNEADVLREMHAFIAGLQ
jgi:hypothetical protein